MTYNAVRTWVNTQADLNVGSISNYSNLDDYRTALTKRLGDEAESSLGADKARGFRKVLNLPATQSIITQKIRSDLRRVEALEFNSDRNTLEFFVRAGIQSPGRISRQFNLTKTEAEDVFEKVTGSRSRISLNDLRSLLEAL